MNGFQRVPGVVGRILRADPSMLIRPLGEVERAALVSAMILCRGDIDLACRRLSVSRATLYRRLAELREHENTISQTSDADYGSGETVSGEFADGSGT